MRTVQGIFVWVVGGRVNFARGRIQPTNDDGKEVYELYIDGRCRGIFSSLMDALDSAAYAIGKEVE